jgi:hypothetical protein
MRKVSRRRQAGSLPLLAGPQQNWAQQSLTHPMVKQVAEVLTDPTDAVKSWLEKLLSQVKINDQDACAPGSDLYSRVDSRLL